MVAPIINMPNTEKNSGVSGIPTQLLVLHSGECPLRGGYAQSLTQWANVPLDQGGPEASWHWFVDPIAIVSMVDPMLAAWHASEANPMSEGFEQGGYARFTRAEWLTPEGAKQMDNLAWLMAQRATANDIPAVWLTTDQITRVTTYGDRATRGFATHRQIDPETRTDPGDGYPYDLLLAKIRAYMGSAAVGPQSTTTAPVKKESEMPVSKRVDSAFKARHRLPKGKAYTLSVKDDGASANFAVNGVGHYLIHNYIRGEGLLPGQRIKAQFFITKAGKTSGHFEQDIVGTIDGTFDHPVVFNRPVEAGTVLTCLLTSSNTETAHITGFGAEVSTWAAA
jgi:hypothetical protein